MRTRKLILILQLMVSLSISCRLLAADTNILNIDPPISTNTTSATKQITTAPVKHPVYNYEVVNVYPHDPKAFTQGLVFLNGILIESTGLNGQSSLRKVDLKTGTVLKKADLPTEYFGEGLAVLGGKIYQLTWQSRKGFVYSLDDFRLEREFAYDSEGWGLATDNRSLILSDGTDRIRFIDPANFKVTREIRVRDNSGHPVERLNELEYINGEIFANIWGLDYIIRIDPLTGKIIGAIDFKNLLTQSERQGTDVLNGIAYDPKEQRLFLTGKLWPKLFEIRMKTVQ